MDKPITYYQNNLDSYNLKLNALKKNLKFSSLIRLITFFIIIATIYFFWSNSLILIPAILIEVIVFVFLILKHETLVSKKEKIIELIKINEHEILALNGDYSQFEDGHEFIDSSHYFSYDIDLFGPFSFFQFVNRTKTQQGKTLLAKIFNENVIDQIKNKQNAIKELKDKKDWRQEFLATAAMASIEINPKIITNWIKNYEAKIPNYFKFIPTLFSGISIVLFCLLSFGYISFFIVMGWFFIGLGITSLHLKKINHLYQNANKAKSNFNQYHKLLSLIEDESFESEDIVFQKDLIKTHEQKASMIFKQFSKILDAFDQRNNMLFGILGNGFLLWDLRQSYAIEKWINQYHNNVEKWFSVIAYFDAKISLANYAFNHQGYVFPVLSEDENIIKAQKLGHPLIDEKKRIDNDFHIDQKEFFIVTGANMAGKSTFLRTISLSIVMANIGLPICAKSFIYNPIKLITSMRTTDSLSKDESYFFSELKRLKFMVDQIETDNYFIVLDEILKGTNSTDKAIGSQKFVERLVRSGSSGIIATHDLSLCEIEKEYPQIKNKYFDAEIINNELHFDYHLKEGICQNMNASFLLKKLEII